MSVLRFMVVCLLGTALSGAGVRGQTLRLADPGSDPGDSTSILQAALHAGARTVIVARLAAPWQTRPLFLTNNLTVVFEPGAEIRAKADAFHGRTDSLFTAAGVTNVRLIGPGATLRMRRDDYAGTKYSKAEWRHALTLRGARQILVEGLTLAESGGDGIYVGAGADGSPCRDVTIRRVVCDRNYRQGISVISADGLLIEDCVLRDTGGTAPAAGIDFEPNRPSEQLTDCVLRRTVMENNQGFGLHLALHQLDGSSRPVDIRIEDCFWRGTNARSASVHTINDGTNGPPRGAIEFNRCQFADAPRPGFRIGSKPADGIAVRFSACTVAAGDEPVLLFQSRPRDRRPMGGLRLDGVTITGAPDPWMRFDDLAGVLLRDVAGELTIDGKPFILDDDALARLVPQDPVLQLTALVAGPDDFQPLEAGNEQRTLPAWRVRGAARWFVAAKRDETVRLSLRHRPIGRSQARDVTIRVVLPGGKTVTTELKAAGTSDLAFTTARDGVSVVTWDAGAHAVEITAATHPVVLAPDGPAHFIGSTGTWYVTIPAGVTNLGVRVAGQGEGERVGAELLDPAGASVWQDSNIGWASGRVVACRPGDTWTLRITRPAAGHFEDFSVDLRGLPALLRPQPPPRKPAASGQSSVP